MSSSLYIPLRKIPKNLSEIKSIVCPFLSYPEELFVDYHLNDKPKKISDNIIYIEYQQEEYFLCFSNSVYEITGSKEFNYDLEIMAINAKRMLLAIVAYSFCDENYIIFNDDGLLGGNETFTKSELYDYLKERYYLDPVFRQNYLMFI